MTGSSEAQLLLQQHGSNYLSGVPRRVRYLVILLSLNTLAVGYFTVVLTSYLPQTGVSSGIVGTILGVEGITLVLAGIPLGMLSDRMGRKWILTISSMGLSPVLFIIALTRNEYILILAGVIAGLAEGGFLATLNAILADQTPEEVRDSVFSFSFVLSTVSTGIGFSLPFAFPFLEGTFGISSSVMHDGLLLIFGFLVILTPFGLYFLLRDYKEKLSPSQPKKTEGSLRNLIKFSSANSLVGLGAGFIIPLIATWLWLKFGVADNYSGPLLAISSITMGLAALVSPRMSKRFGIVRAIVINQGLSTIFMLALAFVGEAALAAGLYVIRAALMNMSSPLSDSFLMGLVPKERRGLASAINSVVWRLPNSLTSIAGGVILASGNYSLPFELATLFYVIGIFMFFLFFKDFQVPR